MVLNCLCCWLTNMWIWKTCPRSGWSFRPIQCVQHHWWQCFEILPQWNCSSFPFHGMYMSFSASFAEDRIYQTMLSSFSGETRRSFSQCENGNFRLDLIFNLNMAPAEFLPHPSVEELPWRNCVLCPTQRLEGQSRRQDFSFVVQKRLASGSIFHNSKIALALFWH